MRQLRMIGYNNTQEATKDLIFRLQTHQLFYFSQLKNHTHNIIQFQALTRFPSSVSVCNYETVGTL